MEALPFVASIAANWLLNDQKNDVAESASNAQINNTKLGMDEIRRQFDSFKELLNPYVKSGTDALSQQRRILGLDGQQAQREAIDNIQNSELFSGLTQQGENAILQNASATGGLRGGNTQAALAKFRPNLLNNLIESQYGKLTDTTGMGQNSVLGLGKIGSDNGKAIANLFEKIGAYQSGNVMTQGQNNVGLTGNIFQNVGGIIGALSAGGF